MIVIVPAVFTTADSAGNNADRTFLADDELLDPLFQRIRPTPLFFFCAPQGVSANFCFLGPNCSRL
jgi:hypothetical protein